MAKTATAARTAPTDDAVDARILGVAAKLFRERGFSATTVREIAAAAEILPGSLHYRFGSKDQLLVQLLERGTARAMTEIQRAMAPEKDPVERLRLALRVHLKLLLGGEDAIYVLLFESRAVAPEIRETMDQVRSRYEAFWDGLIFEAAGTGRSRMPVDLELLRHFGFGAMCWVAQWFDARQGRTPEQIADAFWNYLCFGLIRDDARPSDVDARFSKLMEA